MKIEITKYWTHNVYIPYYGWLSQCAAGYWASGKHEDGPLYYDTVYPALQDMGMNEFRLNLWEDIVKRVMDRTA